MRKITLLSLVALLIVTSINISPAAAESPFDGKVVKRKKSSTLYYINVDGDRYVFPNEKTFKSWFTDFSDIEEVDDEELSNFPLTGNIRYRPGISLIKIQTDPKVYAVGKNGTLRWIKTEKLAKRLYGDFWNQLIDDISAAFFANYIIGQVIDDEGDFDPDQEITDAETIEDDEEDEDKHKGKKDKKDKKKGRKSNTIKRHKVAVCHSDGSHTIIIARPALQAHLAHGDTEGRCEGDEDEDDEDIELEINDIQKEKTDTTAIIAWSTNLASTSKIEYADESLTTASSTTTLGNDDLVTNHSLELTELTPSTTYYFILSSTDADGNAATSSEKTFDTKDTEPVDVTAPVISDVATSAVTTTTSIAWTTDELSPSRVEYATSSENLANSPLIETDTTMATDHLIELIDLTASTTYYFIIKSEDSSGNVASTTEATFTTQDITAPVISDVNASTATSTATVTWTTDEVSDSEVKYALTSEDLTNSPLSEADSTEVTSHSIELTGLTAETTYYFTVESEDGSSNIAVTTEDTFDTLAE